MVLLATTFIIFGLSTAHLSVNFENALHFVDFIPEKKKKEPGIIWVYVPLFGLDTASFTYLMNK